MKRGLFVVVDGPSGSGKSTIVHGIGKYLFDQGKYESVLITRAPSDTPSGRKSRELREEHKRQGISTHLHAETYSQLYFADGQEQYAQIIKPALNQGIHVVSDRSTVITQLAYQRRENIPLETLLTCRAQPGMPRPDITLILDLDPTEACRRIDAGGRARSSLERVEIMEELRTYFCEIPSLLPAENIVVIDASKDPHTVLWAAIPHVRSCLDYVKNHR